MSEEKNVIEIEESFDPLREDGETLAHYASRMAGRPDEPQKQEQFLREYKALSDLNNLESGELRGPHGEGDHVKAAWRENGFELSLLAILYRIEQHLGHISESLEKAGDKS